MPGRWKSVWKLSCKVPLYISLWYMCSAVTLFMNKYLLTYLGADPNVLGCTQLLSTTFYGCLQIYVPRIVHRRQPMSLPSPQTELPSPRRQKYDTFYRDVILVGIMRFGTVVLGLVSLKSVAVSFTETIKASAPMFTVVTAWLLLGERSGVHVNFSLVPIMVGLILTSYTELSFQMVGFVAALLNNVIDCIQNVFSKKLISRLNAFTPTELQFYSSVAAVLIQFPVWFVLRGFSPVQQHISGWMLLCLAIDGLMFHLQSIAAYYVVSVVSPVSYSVSNTVKRAVLTWLSVVVFGNRVTVLTVTGIAMVIGGVFVYSVARNHEDQLKKSATEHSPKEEIRV